MAEIDGVNVSGLAASTFMRRHTAGVNSTGMYIISGIPYIKTLSGAVANDGTTSSALGGAVLNLPSLSREITFMVTTAAGNVEVAFETARVIDSGEADDGDAIAGVEMLTIPNGTTITLPVRVKKIWYKTVAGGATLQVAATLTGLAGSAYENYPLTKGDGYLTPLP